MFSKNTRAGIFLVAAGYLIYLAVDLFRGRNDPGTTMAPWLAILFSGFFIIASIVILFIAFRTWKKKEDEDDQNKEENDINNMK